MSKAALIMDIPERCEECILCKRMEDNCYYCMATNQIIVDVALKKYECPLRVVPQKDKSFARNNTYHYQCGWNDCIDKILGE